MAARQITAMAMDAPRQPQANTMGGTSSPANAPPRGTPVCLMENTRGIRRGGVVRARIWELAGVVGP